MGEFVKWALLAVAIVGLIALVLSLPFAQYVGEVSTFSSAIHQFVSRAGDALTGARGIVNNFFLVSGRRILSGIMFYIICKWLITVVIKITAWVYHFIFK